MMRAHNRASRASTFRIREWAGRGLGHQIAGTTLRLAPRLSGQLLFGLVSGIARTTSTKATIPTAVRVRKAAL
jgi:hypothetical protein